MLDFDNLPDGSGLPSVETQDANANSITIRLYRYSAEPNIRVKSPYLCNYDGSIIGITGDVKQGTFRTPFNYLSPTILIESDIGFPWNYLAVYDYDSDYTVDPRYYFVNTVTCIRKNLYEVNCTEDVLTTFGDVIKDYGYGFVDRNENVYHNNIPDNNRVFEYGQDISDFSIYNNTITREYFGVWFVTGMGIGSAERGGKG